MNRNTEIAMIAAVGPERELGSEGDLIWHISADLKNFKRLTSGHPVIMGRKTWESLPKKPLPGRLNIVVTRRPEPMAGAETASSAEEALRLCGGETHPFVIGGAEIYSLFMPVATRLYLTRVEAPTSKKVDSWFPEYDNDWKIEDASEWFTDPGDVRYRFETWTRK